MDFLSLRPSRFCMYSFSSTGARSSFSRPSLPSRCRLSHTCFRTMPSPPTLTSAWKRHTLTMLWGTLIQPPTVLHRPWGHFVNRSTILLIADGHCIQCAEICSPSYSWLPTLSGRSSNRWCPDFGKGLSNSDWQRAPSCSGRLALSMRPGRSFSSDRFAHPSGSSRSTHAIDTAHAYSLTKGRRNLPGKSPSSQRVRRDSHFQGFFAPSHFTTKS